jgi:polygalacturonase
LQNKEKAVKTLEHVEIANRHERLSARISPWKQKAIKVARLFCVAPSILPAIAHAKVCDVRSYGAKGDGVTKDTKAIQAAIDDCSAAGGGTVRLSGGKFVIAPIELKSNLELDIEKDAELLGSPDRDDYPKAVRMRQQTVEPLIAVTNATNVTIKGGGVIDGQGKVWWDYVKGVKDSGVLGADHPRPMLLLIDHSKHMVVEDVTIQNSGFWQVVPYYSDDLIFRNLRILAPQRGAPNTDAIDPFSSSHVTIDHVFSSTGDDNVAIKSGAINSPGPDAPSHDITITDCEFEAGHGLSIGSEVAGGVQNVHAERIHFKGTDQGIRVKANRDRGNDVSNLSFKDITMENVRTAILISEYYPKVLPEGDVLAAPIGRLTPFFHDIHIENVIAVGSDWAGVIIGLPESPVKGLTMKNVSISATKGLNIAFAQVTMDRVDVKVTQGDSIIVDKTAQVSIGK